jgi:TrmH family RNA methyltransferase
MITSTANKRVKWVRALQNKRRARQRDQAFVIEGARLAREVIAADHPVDVILYTEDLDNQGRELVEQMVRLGGKPFPVSEAVMASCSDTQSPPGLLAVLPIRTLLKPKPHKLALVVDHLADPGNLGTLLRTALAVGVEVVYLSEGCVDPHNPKVVRGAMGAHLQLPVLTTDEKSLPLHLAGLDIWLAEAHVGRPYTEVDWRRPVALIIGGEAHGPQPAVRALAKGQVHIPMPGGSESLNAAVAAAVILFEIIRQRGEE